MQARVRNRGVIGRYSASAVCDRSADFFDHIPCESVSETLPTTVERLERLGLHGEGLIPARGSITGVRAQSGPPPARAVAAASGSALLCAARRRRQL